MSAPYGDAALLGMIQGITEFLPISSDGHLALAELLWGMKDTGLTLNVMLHVGTLFATLILLRSKAFGALFAGLRALLRPSLFRESSAARDAGVVILASLPTAAIGLVLRDAVERWTESPLIIGLGFLVTALALVSTRFLRARDAEQPNLLGALLIGAAQGLAVLPGISRSGLTITTALWLGVRPDRAFELSMLMSLPAVLGATLLEAPHAWRASGMIGPAAIGAAVAFGVGLIALGLLRRIVVRGHFSLFAIWVLPVALATLALAKAWPQP